MYIDLIAHGSMKKMEHGLFSADARAPLAPLNPILVGAGLFASAIAVGVAHSGDGKPRKAASSRSGFPREYDGQVLLALRFDGLWRTILDFSSNPGSGSPKERPTLRVARLDGVCSIAALANGRAIGCAPRLASVRPATQRTSRRKPDRLLDIDLDPEGFDEPP